MAAEFVGRIVAGAGGGAAVPVPPEVLAEFGGRNRTPVVATFDGVPYRGSIASMGDGPVIGVRREIRDRIGKQPGDEVRVTLARDDAPRTVEVPADLDAALAAAPGARARFDALSHSHRREHVQSVVDAKRPETRARRIERVVATVRG